jgi:hypothetical protein
VAVWFLFLAGAFAGGVASSLLEPQPLLADPVDLNGQKFQDLEALLIQHDDLLSGISRDESGRIVFSDPLVARELSVECDPDSDRPALSVCGRSLFTGEGEPDQPLVEINPFTLYKPALLVKGSSQFTGDAGPDRPLVEIDPLMLHPKPELLVRGPSKFTGEAVPDQPLMVIMPEVHEGPALTVEGTALLKPVDGLPGLIAEGPTGDVCIHPDRIELLVDCEDPTAGRFATFGFDELGSYLGVDEILADRVRANEFETDEVIQPF